MTWANVYLGCFLVGLSLCLLLWLLGMIGVHLHLPHGVTHALGSAAAHAHAGPPAMNASTLMAFLAWFGGTGYLLARYSEVWPLVALVIALAAGIGGAAVVFWVMARVLWSANENLDPDDYDLIGLIGTVSSRIRAGGTGEILYQQAGARRVSGARSEDGRAIDKGTEIVITRVEKGLAYVRTWADLSAADSA